MSELEDLERLLTSAAAEHLGDDEALAGVLRRLGEDVARASQERLPIFPVAHHSPASGVHMVRRLRERPPKVIFLELCEDLLGRVADLADCTLPVALQAFAGEPRGHPERWAPLSLVAPITEMSAEYQAIAFAQQNPGVELVFVDRSVDHVFQWEGPDEQDDEDDDEDAARYHGGAKGVRVGDVMPTFGAFAEALLQNARVSHFSEWWTLYVDEPSVGADTESYRRMYFLIGSLFRQLGRKKQQLEVDEPRERFMWTRMKDWLTTHGVAPEDALYVCGAAHTASPVPEFGVDSPARWDIPVRTETAWSYGLIPSSHAAVEWQFGMPTGAITVAEGSWKKALKTHALEPFRLGKKAAKKKKARAKAPKPGAPAPFSQLLKAAPQMAEQDAAELLDWCARIVRAARGQRYMASTADAIAIYETSLLLARMRARARPSPWDFMDAAETCLEKDRVPGRRSIRQLCGKLLGGDRVGQVGYSALPPLVQDVYDRLAKVGITAATRNVKRVLLNLDEDPALEPVSDLLWRLQALLPGTRVARPIMGHRELGQRSRQESWDVRLSGPEQRAVIELAFDGVTVEQVLERRLNERAFDDEASASDALEAAEASLLFLSAPRVTDQLGGRAAWLLGRATTADDAPAVFARVRRLVQHFRGTPEGPPPWLEQVVQTGYLSYCALLPAGFADRGTEPAALAAALGFVLTLESLALTMGCDRSQLLIALDQAAPLTSDPEKLGLRWAAELLVGRMNEREVRAAFERVLDNPLSRDAYPRYLAGFLTTLSFTGRPAALGVALLGAAFHRLPDRVLMAWFPGLLSTLQPYAADALPALMSELKRGLPKDLAGLDAWDPAWTRPVEAPREAAAPVAAGDPAITALLTSHREPIEAWARALGLDPAWPEAGVAPAAPAAPAPRAALLERHPDAARAWAAALGPK